MTAPHDIAAQAQAEVDAEVRRDKVNAEKARIRERRSKRHNTIDLSATDSAVLLVVTFLLGAAVGALITSVV